MKAFDSQNNYYIPGFFWIELDTAKELNDIFKTDFEHLFFHEYLHFLQDITTTYGYANSSHILNLIKAFYQAIKMSQQLHDYDLKIPFNYSNDYYREINARLFRTYLQYYDKQNNRFDKFVINECTPIIENINGFKVQTFIFKFNGDKEIRLGAHAFFESISHLLQKECYKIKDTCVYMPYDLPEKIAENYSVIFQNKAYLIDLCEYSLMFFNPCEVFMNILTGIKNDNYIPKNTDELYGYMKYQVNFENESVEAFLEKEKEELISNINGVFVSELYCGFKKWLVSIVESGYNLKIEKKLIFSKILSYNPTDFLRDTIIKIGMPPTFNQDGKMFIRNSVFDIDAWVYLAKATYSVFETIMAGKTDCMLKEACLISNELRDKKIHITDDCDNMPWKKINEEELCPYCAVWKTFGLSNMNIIV
jgi:hypothetical protein